MPGGLDLDRPRRHLRASDGDEQIVLHGVAVGGSGPTMGSLAVGSGSAVAGSGVQVGVRLGTGKGVKVGISVGAGWGGGSRATMIRLMTMLATMMRLNNQNRIWLVLLFRVFRLLKTIYLLKTGFPL